MKQLLILIGLLVVTLEADAQNWVRTNGPVEGVVFDLCVAPNGWLYAMTRLGLNRTTNGGDHWTRPFQFSAPSSTQGRVIIAKNGNVIFSGDSGIYVSTDNGQSFSQTYKEEFGAHVSQFAITSSGRIFAARWWSVVSDDNGLTWNDVSAFGQRTLQATSFAASHDTIVAQFGTYIYWSTNNGQDWSIWGKQAIYTPSLYIGHDGSWVAVTPLDVFRQVDHTDTTISSWKSIVTSEFESDSIFLSFNRAEDGSTFLGTLNNLWMAKQFSNWRRVATRIDLDGIVNRVVYDSLSGIYYLALMSGGVWKTKFPLSANEPQHDPIKLQIFPNPIASTARIRCSLPQSAYIGINIMDNIGRTHMRQLEHLESGTSDITISLNSLPSGNYFVQVRCGEHKETKSIVVTK